jgi:two-component system, OmpR family, sensor histidine kinase QseC
VKLQPSLLRHLLAWALGALLVVWATFVAVGYRTGAHEADELTDGHLASVASLLLAQRMGEFVPAPGAAALGGRTELKAHDYQQSLSIVVWDGAGRVIGRNGEAPTPAFAPTEGFETLALGQPAAQWRAFSRWDGPGHEKKIMVLLSMAERDDLADDIAEQVATPGLWLLPVVALVLVLAIRKGLRPLSDLSRDVHRLDIHHDTALRAPPHEEFKAVVQSINTLIERYNAALARERELASEVAHELRTPLASLSLHAGLLRGALAPAEREEALHRVQQDAARAASVLADLLALARASRAELAEAAEELDLAALARRVAAEYGQPALESGHELSVRAPAPCVVNGHPVLLELALRNLIENALHHTPRGTSVRVRVMAAPAGLEVCDDSPALARGESMDAPARHQGLGLGHQVVRRVAAVHDGKFEIAQQASGERLACYRLLLGDLKPRP